MGPQRPALSCLAAAGRSDFGHKLICTTLDRSAVIWSSSSRHGLQVRMYRPAAKIGKDFNRRRIHTPPSLKHHL
jgi:hypothetical protein